MKTFFLMVISVLFFQNLAAQMDEKFYFPDKEWISIEGVNYEEMMFLVEKDTIYPAFIKPIGKPKATILYFHGNGGNISKWISSIRPLIEDGYQVCMLDYRGYGKSTGTPTHINIAHDAQFLLDTLLSREDVKDTQLIIYGASIGTQVACLLTHKNEEKVTGLVLDSMMTSFTDVAIAFSPEEHHSVIKQYVTSPYSAKEIIPVLKKPRILFIHSAEDLIPIEGAYALYEGAKCVKYFWQYDGKHVEAPIKHPDTFMHYINQLH